MPSEDEEWRRFLAREVDLVPSTTPSHLQYLREVPSVRIVNVINPISAAVIFRVHGSVVADVRVRQAISMALRRRAIAQTVTGEPEAAYPANEDLDAAKTLADRLRAEGVMPSSIRLYAPDSSTDFQRAALVVGEQLASIGVQVHAKALSLEELQKAMNDGDFDILVFDGGFGEGDWPVLQLPDGRYTGYRSAEFDDAAARHDAAGVTAVLQRDLPETPLYWINQGVAVDRRICWVHPQSMIDLTWLADIHLCSPEENE